METNPVYKAAEYDEALVAAWIPDIEGEMVPQPILDAVICVPTEGDPGKVVTEGPADATINGQQEREDADVQAAKQARYISAFEPKVTDLNADAEQATGEVVSLLDQLEALDRMTQRSVALETLSAVEGGASLIDDEGRARLLEISRDVWAKCKKLSSSDAQAKLERENQKAVLGVATWQQSLAATTQDAGGGGPTDVGIPLMEVPRGPRPLSLWDWKVWTQARPTLWCYGDGGNLYPHRPTPLLTAEWIDCMLRREELVYDVPGDPEPFVPAVASDGGEINRFSADWMSIHLFATLYQLSETRRATFAFLKNGGFNWAKSVALLTANDLVTAARAADGTCGSGGLQSIMQTSGTPKIVRDALNAMQMATADVVGTDGHRRLCRHEGHAYMVLFGAPLVFTTPNLADGKLPLLLIVQGEEVRLDHTLDNTTDLPKYRTML